MILRPLMHKIKVLSNLYSIFIQISISFCKIRGKPGAEVVFTVFYSHLSPCPAGFSEKVLSAFPPSFRGFLNFLSQRLPGTDKSGQLKKEIKNWKQQAPEDLHNQPAFPTAGPETEGREKKKEDEEGRKKPEAICISSPFLRL